MKICFLARPSFDHYSVAILKKIHEKYDENVEGYFITTNEKESKYVLSEVENARVFETANFIREHWSECTEEKLNEFEKKYDCAPIWKYIYTDRFLVKRKYDYVVHITVGLFMFFEEIFKDNEIDFYYSETIATLQCYVAYLVGKKYGVKYISQMCARGSLDSTYHYFVREEFQYNSKFDVDYLNREYTLEEMQWAEEYLFEFEQKDSPPPAMSLVQTRPRINLDFFLCPIKRLILSFRKEFRDPCAYMYYELYKEATNPIKYYFNYKKAQKFYVKPDYDRKFVYYPLHYQPEATTCVCAQKYENQLFYIDSWAKSLPADTLLYVKEHYALLGNRDPQFYVELQKYPNVVLVDPWEGSRKLIEKSVAVTTLAGTAGFEAMLLRKPVFLGGNIVFDNAPGIIKITDMYQNYMSKMNDWVMPKRDDIKKYLCACKRSYSKGNAYAQNYYELIADNIDDIVDSLYAEMKILYNEKE